MTLSNNNVTVNLIALFLLINFSSACTYRIGDLTLLSSKNIDLSDARLDAQSGQRFKGRDCTPVFIVPFGLPNLEEATDEALEKGKGNVLVDQVTTWWTAPFVWCIESEGTVLNIASTETQQKASTPAPSKPTDAGVVLARSSQQFSESNADWRPSSPIVGVPSVIDGNTIEIRGKRIQLHGIDAPEGRQMCLDEAGEQYGCGREAALALLQRLSGLSVHCEPKRMDKHQQVTAVCHQGQQDLSTWMVRSGFAVAVREQSTDYVAAEDSARGERVGIWRGEFLTPWDFRRTYR